ncbi:MAG: methyltransferase [Candidatus Cloacimonadaceae bacterium]|nr:methyltransferase [Candidatus Cloacimonadota bacterium]MDY0127834.1 methyltransferase [Candidatus Cloacimonadaceae bacterium]MCB5254082.1 methyltransferase [Candidatus Cloacimonadota bacterium]MCK9178202.1 methyltransferase [Candidatus Cloacimonadota bacterium]MCK9242600.1 methyltransferase [Candidatus Cloacimonadota bacterium]
MEQYPQLSLPFPDKVIRQDPSALGASLASQLLYDTIIDEFDSLPLRMLELGCGSGIVSIMCALSRPLWQITAIDIQPHLISLAKANARDCQVDIAWQTQDLKQHRGEYDLIVSNPPWQKLGSGILSPSESRNLSRFEIACSMGDITESIQLCLAPSGSALLIYPQSRNQNLIHSLDNTLLDIKKQYKDHGTNSYVISLIRHGRDI